jgi:hypothetical protein
MVVTKTNTYRLILAYPQLEVIDSIIVTIAIDVVNLLSTPQGSSDMPRHNQAML